MSKSGLDNCELCDSAGGEVIWENGICRVVMVADPDYPGFCRVILHRHLREMTDLPHKERMQLMTVLFAVETAVRSLYQPDKINLASLGNMVPHLHWHIIPRFRDDRHFPESIWGPAQRDGVEHASPQRQSLHGAIVAALTELTAG